MQHREGERELLHNTVNVHLSPRDVNCFADQQMIIKTLLKSEKNYPKTMTSDRAVFVLVYAFDINVYFCPLHAYK